MKNTLLILGMLLIVIGVQSQTIQLNENNGCNLGLQFLQLVGQENGKNKYAAYSVMEESDSTIIAWNGSEWEVRSALAPIQIFYTSSFASSPNPPGSAVGNWQINPAIDSCPGINNANFSLRGSGTQNTLEQTGNIIVSILSDEGDEALFELTSPQLGDFALQSGQTDFFNELSAGTYDITQILPMGRFPLDITIEGDLDNGSSKTISNEAVLVDLDPGETIVVTFINQNSCTDDEIAPEFTDCPELDLIITNDPGECGAIYIFDLPTATDDCTSSPEVFQDMGPQSGSLFPVGRTLLSFTARDDAGNVSVCDMIVEVVDNETPAVDCNAAIEVAAEEGQCSAIVSYPMPSAIDNCPDLSVEQTQGLGSGAIFPIGTTIEEYTFTDPLGNSSICRFNVTVIDEEAPVIECPEDTSVILEAAQCEVRIEYEVPVGTDNCPNPFTFLENGAGSGSLFPVGSHMEIYAVTDLAENTGRCVFTINVVDQTPPLLTCPADTTIEIVEASCSAIVDYELPVATDNCSAAIVTLTQGLGSGSAFPVGIYEEEYTAIDESGNSTNCKFTINIIDNEQPIIFCPDDTTINVDPGLCAAVVNYSLPSSIDNCDDPTIELLSGLGTGASFPVGSHTERYAVIDAASNTDTCSFIITVVDVQVPAITCPADIVVDVDPGSCLAIVDYPLPQITDNCPDAILTQMEGLGPGQDFPVGLTTEKFRVTDPSGNQDSCSFTITVIDNEAPVINCPGDIAVILPPGQCDTIIEYGIPAGFDLCQSSSTALTQGLGSGARFSAGNTTEQYTVTDISGNADSCSFLITVIDLSPPMISCPTDTFVNVDPGSCSAIVDYITPVGTDDCPDINTVLNEGLESGSAFPVGSTLVSFDVTDGFENTASCSFTITVVDNEAPKISCPNDTIVSAEEGACEAIVNYSIPVGTDNCPDVITAQLEGISSGRPFPLGVTTQTFEATDNNELTATCSFTVTVEDDEDPILECPQNIEVNTDPEVCTAQITYANPIAIDNCEDINPVLVEGLSSGSDFPPGAHIIRYEAVDAAGNIATCSFSVTVYDREAPILVCPNDTTIYINPGTCATVFDYDLPTATDNCSMVTVQRSSGQGPGGTFLIGTTAESYFSLDAAGNLSSCSFNITVVDNEAPDIACPIDTVLTALPGTCEAIYNYIEPAGEDLCLPTSTIRSKGLPPGVFPVGTTTVEYRATDLSGNIATCQFNVTVVDENAPQLSCPENITVSTDEESCSAVVDYISPSGNDNCEEVTVELLSGIGPGGNFPPGSSTETYIATDESGNTATCSFQIIVADSIPPIIDCPADTIVFSNTGNCNAIVDYIIPGGTDNCSGVNTTQIAGLGSGATFPNGVTTETFQATDNAGNSTQCSFTITVRDTIAPSISCPDNIIAPNLPSQCTGIVNYIAPIGTDNCPGPITTQIEGQPTGAHFLVGENIQTFVVEDASGNTDTCSFTITIVDEEKPEISCPADTVVSTDPESCSAVVNYDLPFILDNCTDYDVILENGMPSGSTFPIDTTLVTFIVMDTGQNRDTCSFRIVVQDQVAPRITCPGDTTVNAAPGQCAAIVNYTIPVGIDNCELDTTLLTAGLGSGAEFFVGENIETYTTIDEQGLTANCSFTITINDNEAPEITCPDDITVFAVAGSCSAVVNYAQPEALDNCPDFNISLIDGLGSGAAFPVGNNTETFTVTDASGNTSSCNFTITVIDTIAPSITCPNDTTVAMTSNQCSELVNYNAPTGIDNCGTPMTNLSGGLGSGSTFPVGNTIETYTTIDESGNEATCSFTITVVDSVAPVIDCPQNIITANQLGNCGATVTFQEPTLSDNCGTAVLIRTSRKESGSFFDIGTETITYLAIDDTGNIAECSFNVTVEDRESPNIICLDTTVTLNALTGLDTLTATELILQMDDNCEIATTTLSKSIFDCSGTDSTYVIVEDVYGNTDSCLAFVTVIGETALPEGFSSAPLGFSEGSSIYSSCQEEFLLNSKKTSGPVVFNQDWGEFTYLTLEGDFEISCRVKSLRQRCLAGLMIRENLFEDAKYAYVGLSPAVPGGAEYGSRNRNSTSRPLPNVALDRSNRLKIIRNADTVKMYIGQQIIFFQIMSLPEELTAGLFLTSREAQEVTATFDQVSVVPLSSLAATRKNLSNNEQSFTDQLNIWPNPSAGLINLSIEPFHGRSTTLIIYDIYGKFIRRQNLGIVVEHSYQLDLSSLQDGTYIIELRAGALAKRTTVILQR